MLFKMYIFATKVKKKIKTIGSLEQEIILINRKRFTKAPFTLSTTSL